MGARFATAAPMLTLGAMRPLALVTGASSGIGLEIARLLAPDHDLVLVARRRERLEALNRELGGRHQVVDLDLAVPGADLALFARVPSCDVLINDAGVGIYGDLVQNDVGRVAALIELNVRTPTLLARRYVAGMIERGRGAILNVASAAALNAEPGMAVYAASKAYLLSFSEALHHEVKGRGVSVTCLLPGPTETEFTETAGVRQALRVEPPRWLFAPPDRVARIGVEAMRKGQISATAGATSLVAVAGSRLLPRRTVAWVTGRILSKGR